MTAISDSNWQKYVTYLRSKEGTITNVIKYLLDHMEIYETSTSRLRNEFPIYDIIMLVYNQDFCTGQSIDEKIIFLQRNLEILFNYSKNLLIKFSIYRDKIIKVDTPQISNYLLKFPNYTVYLLLMGYKYQKMTEEWQFSENLLTNERQSILFSFTANCCLGHDYWNNCLKYLSLSIFSSHRLSIETLLVEKKCEYCEFDLDLNQYCCAVCEASIDKMPFFEHWKLSNFSRSQSVDRINEYLKSPPLRYASLNPTISNTFNFQANDSENISLSDQNWNCECSSINPSNQLNCLLCYREKPKNEIFHIVQTPTRNGPLSEINLNRSSNRAESEMQMDVLIKSTDNHYDTIGNNWICSYCGAKNFDSLTNCIVCLYNRPFDETVNFQFEPDHDRSYGETIDYRFESDHNKVNLPISEMSEELENRNTSDLIVTNFVNDNLAFQTEVENKKEILNKPCSDSSYLLSNHKTNTMTENKRRGFRNYKYEYQNVCCGCDLIKLILYFFGWFR